MSTYDYECEKCEMSIEIVRSIKDDSDELCEKCGSVMNRLISGGATIIASGLKPSLADHRESEHTKKVKDPERSVRMRKKAFGHDAVGDPSMQTDPMHIVKRGRTLGGQETEIDKKEFIKAAAKDDVMVNIAKKALKK